ncbi:hypothetical protein M514_13780 [Trichuris suis]|uniref:Uncharacterized protein n=1 Tax=Trichuris suis TaxID=68888 RepID=A0A085N384_9BILA|nr:hypothetical protein M513_13780 [Trichuris suis]KFD63930.1 hypothetical protein M514_13780 [Trichuris suis]KHJ42506.1 hypothetical protein D918_07428 [Trichuris suis]
MSESETTSTVTDVDLKLQHFLFSYRNLIHATTGRTPAELLLGRRLRSKLDLLKPTLDAYFEKKLIKQAEYHDRTAQARSFAVGEKIYVYDQHEANYKKGIVLKRTADSSYIVSYAGKQARKHAIICVTWLKHSP